MVPEIFNVSDFISVIRYSIHYGVLSLAISLNISPVPITSLVYTVIFMQLMGDLMLSGAGKTKRLLSDVVR